MRVPRSILVLLAAVAMFLSVVSAAAIAQTTTLTHLMFVNGASDDPVQVTANGGVVADQLEFAVSSDPAVVTAGSYDVAFGGPVALTSDFPADTAWTVVSGFGEDPSTATAYEVPVEAIATGNAVVAIWNGSAEAVDITVDGTTATVAAGQPYNVLEVAAGSTVSVEAGGQSLDVAPEADNYVSVFVVASPTQTGIATATIDSMQALVDGITPPPPPTVPDVTGQSEAEAAQTLVDAGYVAASTPEASDSVEAGAVIRTQPAAGQELQTGGTVTMFVSTGPSTVVVPDVVGQPEGDALAALEAAGLVGSSQAVPDNEVEIGLVIESNPSAGIAVAPGTTVVLTVSEGPESVTVPDFIGLTVDEATAAAEDAGVAIEFVQDPESPDPEGIVVDQSPQAGETVDHGTTVTLLQAPAFEDAWASIKVEPGRILRAGGLNFQVDSISEVTVLATSLSGKQVVDADGVWIIELDIASLDAETAYEVLVVGTAADGSEYRHTFDLPPEGEFVDQVQPEDEGLPTWVWIVLAIVLVAAVVIGTLLVLNERSKGDSGPDSDPAVTAGATTGAAAEGGAPESVDATPEVDSQEAVGEADDVDDWAGGE